MLRNIADPVDGEVLEGALGKAFVALDQTDWDSHVLLFRPLGLGVLLWSRFLQATADVSLFFAQQDWLWGGLQCESNLRRVFGSVLDKSMMRRYKRVVEEEGDTSGIDANVEEGWELLVKKGGSPTRYCDVVLKVECGYLVEDLIANFGRRHGVCCDALNNYVGGFLCERLYGGDRLDTYHPSEGEQSGTDEGEEDGNDEDDEKDDSSDEGGMAVEVAREDNEDGVTVDKDRRGVPLYDRKLRILMGDK
jgi:hypothetical protein